MSPVARRLALAALLVVAGGAALAGSGFGQSSTEPVVTANRFVISIDGVPIATFQELTGITSEIEPPDTYQYSDRDTVLSKLPELVKPPTITLKRAMTGSLQLWAWHEAVRLGRPDARKHAKLSMFNSEGRVVSSWFLEGAWVSKIDIGTLKAGTTQYVTESVTLVSEYLQRDQ